MPPGSLNMGRFLEMGLLRFSLLPKQFYKLYTFRYLNLSYGTAAVSCKTLRKGFL